MNFPEIWESRVRQKLTVGTTQRFLEGISEVASSVVEMGSDNIIHVPLGTLKPDVLVNNLTYPLAIQDYTDGEETLKLDKFETKATRVNDDQLQGSSYEIIDFVTGSHIREIDSYKYRQALHGLAPAADATETPVIEKASTSFTYADLVKVKAAVDLLEWPEEGRRIVLCNDHYNSLMNDRDRFANMFLNHTAGTVAPMILGFKVFTYIAAPLFTSGKVRKAFGTTKAATDKYASVAFMESNIIKKTGNTKQYFSPSTLDTLNHSSMLNYKHYFMAKPAAQRYMLGII